MRSTSRNREGEIRTGFLEEVETEQQIELEDRALW